MKGGKELTPRQWRAIEHLLTQPSVKAAAQAAGVGYRTLRGWLRQPAFQQALQAVQADALAALQRQLLTLASQGCGVLEQSMRPGENVRTRLLAVDLALRHLLKFVELQSLEERVQRLEERLEELEVDRGRR